MLILHNCHKNVHPRYALIRQSHLIVSCCVAYSEKVHEISRALMYSVFFLVHNSLKWEEMRVIEAIVLIIINLNYACIMGSIPHTNLELSTVFLDLVLDSCEFISFLRFDS